MGIGSSTNLQYQDSAWLANFLQQHEGQTINVQQGPGGVTITVGGESVFIGPSQMGILPSFAGHDVVITGSVDPSYAFLLLPESTSFTLSESWITYFVNYLTPPLSEGSEDGYGYDVGGGEEDINLNLAVPDDFSSSDKTTVLNALLRYTGINDDTALTDAQRTAFMSQLDAIATTISQANANGTPPPALSSGDINTLTSYLAGLMTQNSMSSGDIAIFNAYLSDVATTVTANAYLGGLHATTESDVYDALLSFTGFDHADSLTDAQRTAFTGLLHTLAQKLATQNATGTIDPSLLSLDPSALGTYLKQLLDLTSLSTEDNVLFLNFLSEASAEISSLNSSSGQPVPQSQLMLDMQSTDAPTVLECLKQMLITQGFTSAQMTALLPNLTSLAQKIATANATSDGSGLDLCTGDVLMQALITLLGEENDLANSLLQDALGSIATAFAAENTTYYSVMARSTDARVVLDALTHLSNLSALSPDEQTVALNYLKLMAAALAFMSRVRAKISILEAELRKAESQGKLASIHDQTAAAINTLESGLALIDSELSQTLAAIEHEKLMKWLMPLIMAVMAVVMILITIASAGTLGPVMCALMIASIVVMTAISIAQQQTNFIENLGRSMGITDEVGLHAFSFGFQVVIMALMIACTLGAAAPLCAAQGVALIAASAARQFVVFIVGTALSLLMSSGLVTDGFVLMFKKIGLNEQQSELAAMITTMVLMLIMMVALAAVAGSGAQKAATAVGDAADDVGSAATRTADDVADGATSITRGTGAGAGGAINITPVASAAPDTIMTTVINALNKILAKLAELARDPRTYIQLAQALGTLGQIAVSIQQGVYHLQQAHLDEAQAILTRSHTQTQALVEEIRQILGTFDMTQQDLDAMAQSFIKMITDLMNLFANMVASASQIVSTTTQSA